MPPRSWLFRVRDILNSIAAIEDHVRGMMYEQFAGDRKTIDAVMRNLTVIGEAAANIPPSVQEGHRNVPWDEMRRRRNVVVHVYFGVELSVVWRTLQEDLPQLKAQLNEILPQAERDT